MAIAVTFSSAAPDEDIIRVPHDALLNPASGDYTWCFYARWAADATIVDYGSIFVKPNNTSFGVPRFALWTLTSGTKLCAHIQTSTGVLNTVGGASIRDGLWHQWAITLDQSEGILSILRDGAGYSTVDSSPLTDITPAQGLTFGSLDKGTYIDSGVNCDLANFWCVPRLVDAAELAIHANLYTAPADAVAHWKMKEGSDTTITDVISGFVGTFGTTDQSPAWNTDAGHSIVEPSMGLYGGFQRPFIKPFQTPFRQ